MLASFEHNVSEVAIPDVSCCPIFVVVEIVGNILLLLFSFYSGDIQFFLFCFKIVISLCTGLKKFSIYPSVCLRFDLLINQLHLYKLKPKSNTSRSTTMTITTVPQPSLLWPNCALGLVLAVLSSKREISQLGACTYARDSVF